MDKKIIEWFFMGMTQSKQLIQDKDTANAMEEDFKNTTVQGFVEDMYNEVISFEPIDEREFKHFIVGSGVITREFMEYRIANPIKTDESKTTK